MAERDVAAVVVGVRLVDLEPRLHRRAVTASELDHAGVAVVVRVVHEEAPVGGEAGMEREAQQALLVADRDRLDPECQKRRVRSDDHDPRPVLLHDEDTVVVRR